MVNLNEIEVRFLFSKRELKMTQFLSGFKMIHPFPRKRLAREPEGMVSGLFSSDKVPSR